ncbi:hypothetical protein IU485_27800 [Nocardia cyriacigeorgica]|uniref:hypothetical protein n=1 Tax=Nocardia cyriacigeorgica TaxID=135487 RepID=UPI001894E936|nr:hypothetical protein [Nocardia cyriacigeorgica]MBF6085182.1 hypothetical protein [Nocardia cyriacigeorgica]
MTLSKAQKNAASKQAVMVSTASSILRVREDVPASVATPEELAQAADTIDRVADWLADQARS